MAVEEVYESERKFGDIVAFVHEHSHCLLVACGEGQVESELLLGHFLLVALVPEAERMHRVVFLVPDVVL